MPKVMTTDEYYESLPKSERPIFDQSVSGFVIHSLREIGSFPRSYKHCVQALARSRGVNLTDDEHVLPREQEESSSSPDHPEAPEGGYYIVINDEQTADHRPTLSQARQRGRELCDAEPLPSTWSIQDAHGAFIEEISRSDGKTLETLIQEFPNRRKS